MVIGHKIGHPQKFSVGTSEVQPMMRHVTRYAYSNGLSSQSKSEEDSGSERSEGRPEHRDGRNRDVQGGDN